MGISKTCITNSSIVILNFPAVLMATKQYNMCACAVRVLCVCCACAVRVLCVCCACAVRVLCVCVCCACAVRVLCVCCACAVRVLCGCCAGVVRVLCVCCACACAVRVRVLCVCCAPLWLLRGAGARERGRGRLSNLHRTPQFTLTPDFLRTN